MTERKSEEIDVRIAIITGASSGMGKEFAKQIDKKCLGLDEIWLLARRREPMEKLAKELSCQTRIFSIDLTDADSYTPFMTELTSIRPSVRLLINCAGYGITANMTDLSEDDALGMIDLNCKALTKMTYLIVPYMPRRSYIIQLASAAGFLPQPQFAIYAASKSFVLSLSRALREELKEKGISVTAVCPGPVNTEFFDRSEAEHGDTFAFKKLFLAEKEKVVKQALTDTFHGKSVSVYGLPMKAMRLGSKVIPHKIILPVYAKMILRGRQS